MAAPRLTEASRRFSSHLVYSLEELVVSRDFFHVTRIRQPIRSPWHRGDFMTFKPHEAIVKRGFQPGRWKAIAETQVAIQIGLSSVWPCRRSIRRHAFRDADAFTRRTSNGIAFEANVHRRRTDRNSGAPGLDVSIAGRLVMCTHKRSRIHGCS